MTSSHATGRTPTAIELERAQRNVVRPRMPRRLGDPEARLVRPSPASPVATSWQEQSYRLDVNGVRYALRPAGEGYGAEGPRRPFAGRVYLLGAWHPLGTASTARVCAAAEQALRCDARAVGGVPLDCVTVAGDLTWFERSLLLAGLSDAGAVSLARRHGQPAVVASWTARDIDRLVRRCVERRYELVLDLLDAGSAQPGAWVTQPTEKAKSTYHARNQLSALSKLLKREFDRTYWPMQWRRTEDGSYVYTVLPEIAAWWKAAREAQEQDEASLEGEQ